MFAGRRCRRRGHRCRGADGCTGVLGRGRRRSARRRRRRRIAAVRDRQRVRLRLDEDLALRRRQRKPEVAADILAGAQSELERTARSATAGAAGVALAGGLAAAKATESIEDKIDAARLGAGLDFQLDASPPPAPPKTAASGEQIVRPQPAIDLDKLDLSFDHGDPAAEDATPSVLDGQWHDAATKLDLAKAYQEMGDVEGAREILQEVLREGDDQQKTEAQALIGKLG